MPVFAPDTSVSSLTVEKAGAVIGTRSQIDLYEGSNIALTVTDNAASNRIDVSVAGVVSNYRTAVLALSPASYWTLDETSGTTAADSNSLVNGTYVGSPTLTTAGLVSSGTSVTIGNAQGISLGTSSYSFSGINSFTWAAWINVTTKVLSSNWQLIVNRIFSDGSGTQGYSMSAWFDAGTTYLLQVERYLNGARNVAQSSSVYNLGETHFVVGTYNGSSVALYVDGALVQSTPSTTSLVAGTQTLSLGNRTAFTSGDNHQLSGLLDEVAVWTRALNAGEISSLYSARLS